MIKSLGSLQDYFKSYATLIKSLAISNLIKDKYNTIVVNKEQPFKFTKYKSYLR
jgi:hypothetical protein